MYETACLDFSYWLCYFITGYLTIPFLWHKAGYTYGSNSTAFQSKHYIHKHNAYVGSKLSWATNLPIYEQTLIHTYVQTPKKLIILIWSSLFEQKWLWSKIYSFFASTTHCASLPPRPPFSNYYFRVHYMLHNRDDRHLLAQCNGLWLLNHVAVTLIKF
jgi:hypothetical protein